MDDRFLDADPADGTQAVELICENGLERELVDTGVGITDPLGALGKLVLRGGGGGTLPRGEGEAEGMPSLGGGGRGGGGGGWMGDPLEGEYSARAVDNGRLLKR